MLDHILKWTIIIAFSFAIGLSCKIGQADEIKDLVPFVIQIESSGNSLAVSHCGAIGLMQIMPIVFKEYIDFYHPKGHYESYFVGNNDRLRWQREANLKDAKINVQIGTWYLRRLKDHYLKDDYTIERMLSAYNGGITKLRRLLRQGKDWQDMPDESVAYVKKILKLRQKEKRK